MGLVSPLPQIVCGRFPQRFRDAHLFGGRRSADRSRISIWEYRIPDFSRYLGFQDTSLDAIERSAITLAMWAALLCIHWWRTGVRFL